MNHRNDRSEYSANEAFCAYARKTDWTAPAPIRRPRANPSILVRIVRAIFG